MSTNELYIIEDNRGKWMNDTERILKEKLQLYLADNETDLEIFWTMFYRYIKEASEESELSDKDCFEWFSSLEYRNQIMNLYRRDTDPLNIMLIKYDSAVIGFCTYVIYQSEEGKCFILEFEIEKGCRGRGLGGYAYEKIEKQIKNTGARYIQLTGLNKDSIRFWEKNGFVRTENKNEGDHFYYEKRLT